MTRDREGGRRRRVVNKRQQFGGIRVTDGENEGRRKKR